jgi:hypothetical protein
MVSVLVTGSKIRGFKLTRSEGFLRAIKISITPSFGRELKPEAPCRNILGHTKEFYEFERNII